MCILYEYTFINVIFGTCVLLPDVAMDNMYV